MRHSSASSAPRILVLHVPAGGGHKAAARALAEAAQVRGVECEIVDALDLTPPWFARAYVGAHLYSTEHTPELYGQGYAAMDRRRPVADGLRLALDRALGAELARFVAARAPSAVISTHFFPLGILGHARRRGRLAAPLLGVVTDYAAHAFWAERGVDRFCAARGRAVADLVRHGVPARAIAATGIPIRPAFGAIPALVPPAPGQDLEVLVTSGGFGIGPMARVIRGFAGVSGVHLTVVCGDNAERVAEARRAAEEAGLCATVVGFERDMPRALARAHVLVGKPGGLTVSEALAAGRPMILVGACPGQEASNQAWLLERGAAIAPHPELAGHAARDLRDSGALARLAVAARRLGAPDAAHRVLDEALALGGEATLRPAA